MPLEEPAISVLMPVRDEAEHLPEAANSLSSQTFGDFEIVVVDDGSTDDTWDLLNQWATQDERVRLFQQEAAGIVPALERARLMARGTYLARMDADDIARPERLGAQFALMQERPELVGCGTKVEYFPRTVVREGARRYEAWLNSVITPQEIDSAMFVECPLAHPTFFLRSFDVEQVGGYRDRGWPEDYDLLFRLWAEGGRFAKVPMALLRWRERPDRLSRTHPRYTREAFLACKVHHLQNTLMKEHDSVVIWGAGPIGKAASNALRGAGIEVAAFVELDPRKIGQNIHGAPVVDTRGGLELSGPLHVMAVGQEGVREQIDDLMRRAGYRPLKDFVAFA